MDKETQTIIDQAAEKGAKVAVAQMREFHLDEIKVMRKRMDIGFESVERRFNAVDIRFDGIDQRLDKMDIRFGGIDQRLDGIDGKLEIIDQRLDRTENALQTLLDEFKKHREEVTELKKQISDLTLRVQVLERQLAATH